MRTHACAVLAASLLATSVLAFRDSSPLLIWSSKDKDSLRDAQDALTSGVIGAEEIYRTLPTLGCEWDRVAVVSMEELHQSHIPSLKIAGTPADLHIPYLINPSETILSDAIEDWAQICGADIVGSMDDVKDGKAIIRLDGGRTTSGGIDGTRPEKRQQPDEPERPFPTHTASSSTSTSTRRPTSTSTGTHGHGNSTVSPNAPLLERYQLFSTPIITALLISFAIFIPVVMFGVYALAGIQVPPRMLEIGKGMTVGKEKKDQ